VGSATELANAVAMFCGGTGEVEPANSN
jgi:hypothetical protein